jgi:hypothetical protein
MSNFKIFGVLLLLISTKSLSQEKTITITPELSKSIIDKFNIQSFNIYRVTTKEIEYYPYVEGQVNTDSYIGLLEDLARDKSDYDKYREDVVKDSISISEIQSITTSIDEYLSSKEKSDVKDEILIKAQAIADKYNIEVKGENTDFFAKKVIYTHGREGGEIKTFKLHNGKKSSSKKDIEFYKAQILKLKFRQVELSYGAREYIRNKEIETKIQKTKLGLVPSDKLSKKVVNVIVETPVEINTISGEFIQLSDRYSLILENVENKYVKNELTKDQDEYNEKVKSAPFYIIKKTTSDELYFVMSDQFLFQINNEIEKKRYLNMANTLEYKTWKAKYLELIQSAQVNVNTCKAIIAKHTYLNRRGEKMYDSTTFTSPEKINFNKNLDILNDKNQEIRKLENNRDLYSYYTDKATMEEIAKSYHLSNFFNTTNYSY